MKIIENATVYMCEHCNYTDTMLGRMKAHENKCLSEQLKKNKNTDKQEIYNLLDIDIINIKIRDFLMKYNLPVCTELTYFYLVVRNSLNVDIELQKSIRGIFDRSKFRIYNEFVKTRSPKDYFNTSFEEQLKETERQILLKETEIGILLDKRKDITLEAVKEYLNRKGIK